MFTGGGSGGGSKSNSSRSKINQSPLDLTGVGAPYTPHHHHLQHQHHRQHMNMSSMLQLPPHPTNPLAPPPVSLSSGGGGNEGEEEGEGDDEGGDEEEFPRRDERFPQWGIQETNEFIGIRTELESEFTGAKRNRSLWELVVAKMREKGYIRTPDQCRSKWRNLINKFKEKETIDPNNVTQCPYFEGMHKFHAALEKQIRLPSEAGSSKGMKRVRATSGAQSSGEFYEDDENDIVGERVARGSTAPKKMAKKEKRQQPTAAEKSSRQPNPSNTNNTNDALNTMVEMLQSFFHQQQKIDMEWRESMEKRQHERALFESEWRQGMEKLERERMMMEQARREREEQRRIREESRAEKRDELLTALLNKLIHD